MSPATLPPNPNLEQLKKQAKSLIKGLRSADPASAHRLRQTLSHLSEWTDDEIFQTKFSLKNAQLVVAREYGFERWADLKWHVESRRATEIMSAEEDPMTPEETAALWRRAFMADQQRLLTATERAFVAAAVTQGNSRWDGRCDVAQMDAIAHQDPSVLESIGPAVANIAVATRGCADALQYLLDHNVPFLIEEYRQKEGKEYEYDVIHEAAWAGCVDNLRVLFESGVADATGTANPHVGWPDNVSLLYWPAVCGAAKDRDNVGLAKLLLEFGADSEVKFKGNGERGNTALQEAVSPGNRGKREVARVLIEGGAHYDVLSACALDDLDRVRECARERSDIALVLGEAKMTPLHWAARAGATKCVQWLLNHGAEVDAVTTTRRTPLHLAAENGAVEVIWLLVEQGADVNAQDLKGRTPLHRATYQGQVDAAEALIVLGSNTKIKTKAGKNPLESARLGCKFLKS